MNRRFVPTGVLALTGLAFSACVATAPRSDQGRIFYESGDYLAATDAFSEAIKLNPRSASAWNNRAVARVHMGDLAGAVRDYNRAIELAPGDAEIYFNRGNALVAAGQYPAAIADFDRAVQLAPSYARAVWNRGTAYALAQRPDAAQQDWRAAIQLEGDPYVKAAMRRSASLDTAATQDGKPTTAATIAPPVAFPNVAASQPAASPMAIDARALTSRAISRELDGDRAGALADLNAAVALEPDTARREAIQRLIRLLDTPR
jgi:tetratricopeptide (TPR) repeat protein